MGRRLTESALPAVVATTIGCDQVTKPAAAMRLMGSAPRSFPTDTLRTRIFHVAGMAILLWIALVVPGRESSKPASGILA